MVEFLSARDLNTDRPYRRLEGSFPDQFLLPNRDAPSLMRQLVEQATEPDSIVVDFFAGSGTTAQAVLQQNAEDGGTRRFIMVSNPEGTPDEPERNICRDICGPRIEATIKGFGDSAGSPGDFAYLHCRRIPPGRLTELDHAQVWTALQLIHCEKLGRYRQTSVLCAGDDEQLVVYLPRFRRSDAAALRKAVKASRAVIVYSWQPELVRQQLRGDSHVQVEGVPESLARRFGMKV